VKVHVKCPLHDGIHGRVADPSHPAGHSYTQEQVHSLLWTLSAEDWEDGPRCLLDVLAEIEEGE
jgi:hypothetical protein